MAWYDKAVFYHIYPLGLCGCPTENQGEKGRCFPKLRQWAEHAGKLGCTAIYIGPLFQSSSHGYDTIDYRLVDGRLGSNDDFKEFVSYCHDKGLKVIVDGVFNHVGRDFFAFQELKRDRETSAYKDWFCNVNFGWNNEYDDGFSYDNWGGHNMLVKLNQRHPQVKDYLFATIKFWIQEFAIDGIRLDAADVLDFDFMKEMRSFCDGQKEEFWLMGEVIHGDYSRWANGNMLHSVTDYSLHKALFSGHNEHNYFEIAHTVKRQIDMVGDRIRLYTFIDNHDVSRIWSKLQDKKHMVPVAILQYTLPGIPSLYYGSEFGISGEKVRGSDWNLRPELKLEDFDRGAELPDLFTALGQLKGAYEELTYGSYQELYLTNGQYAFARLLADRAMITVANNMPEKVRVKIPLPFAAEEGQLLIGLEEPAWEIFPEHLEIDLEADRAYVFRISREGVAL